MLKSKGRPKPSTEEEIRSNRATNSSMADFTIPTIDLSPFFTEDQSNEARKKKEDAMDVIKGACSEYGFFQITNHGVPVELMTRALELSKAFFDRPDKAELKQRPRPGAPLPAGYKNQPESSPNKYEYLLMFPPGSSFNVFPENPPELRRVMEQVFSYMAKTCSTLEDILNECLGLPKNFLGNFNSDRSWDVMVALHYFQATELGKSGIGEHGDANCITLVFQDEVGGLEVRKDGDWIPVVPKKGNIIVNMGDVIQVLTNDKFKSATHRVLRSEGLSRYSYAFFYDLGGDKLIEPLPQFTSEIREPCKYRGFLYKDYQLLRLRNKTQPPSRPEDLVRINHYAIPPAP